MHQWVLIWLLLVVGCVVEQRPYDVLVQRASFDLDCPRSSLRYQKFNEQTIGVIGCQKRATYVESCRGGSLGGECTWILNGTIEPKGTVPAAPPAAPSPPVAPEPSSSPDKP
jgi:hypothetical protein